MIDEKLTQQAIDKLLSTPACIESVRDLPCYDYEARFGAFIRVKCGIITLSSIDWPKVAQAIESRL
jgi:hypothetical protein